MKIRYMVNRATIVEVLRELSEGDPKVIGKNEAQETKVVM